MALLHYLSYVAVLAAFAFVTLSLASGLLYVSEMIEEHSRLAKIVGQRGIYVIMALHVVLYFFDSMPLGPIVFSLGCHVVYLQNFSPAWPVISLTSVSFIASSILVVVDHFIWFVHYSKVTQEARHTAQRSYRGSPQPYTPGFADIATFFGICIWLAPLFLFLSLSANDNALPTSSEMSTPVPGSTQPARVSLIRSMFSSISLDALPKPLRPKRRSTEGIIAPRSPGPNQTFPINTPGSQFNSPSLGLSPYGALSPPLRSSSPANRASNLRAELGAQLSAGAGDFTLDTPPARRMQATHRQTSDAAYVGLGLRKMSSTNLAGDS